MGFSCWLKKEDVIPVKNKSWEILDLKDFRLSEAKKKEIYLTYIDNQFVEQDV